MRIFAWITDVVLFQTFAGFEFWMLKDKGLFCMTPACVTDGDSSDTRFDFLTQGTRAERKAKRPQNIATAHNNSLKI
ncbi:MAG: hypothetical protein GF350_12225 [Chitinivibrionales bacterium]|nr:hypothetical protein [Chitinivibrionales bacterium]